MTKQYRIQRSDHLGIVNRAFGGRTVHWSPWRTVAYFPTEQKAQERFSELSRQGLSRTRILYGSEVVAKSL